VRNRRREWLSRNPSYFRSLEHELADTLRYDALIRRFQSAEEREEEGRVKGFGRVLEVDLLRGEARLSRLADDSSRGADDLGGRIENNEFATRLESLLEGRIPQSSTSRSSSETPPEPNSGPEIDMDEEELEVLETEDLEAAPENAEQGRMRWDEFLRQRFVAGRDEDFDYRAVDEDDEYDSLERREQEDTWFDNEEPGWVRETEDDDETGEKGEGKKMDVERPLIGETGVQDF
jgi:hypothetical protein